MAKRRSSEPRRTQWTEADARRVLSDWERSGQSLEAFARSRELVPQRLAWWRKRLRPVRAEASTALTFVPATVTGVVAVEPAVTIRTREGIAIEVAGASPTWIAALMRELARSAS